jgi:hypothetical protein
LLWGSKCTDRSGDSVQAEVFNDCKSSYCNGHTYCCYIILVLPSLINKLVPGYSLCFVYRCNEGSYEGGISGHELWRNCSLLCYVVLYYDMLCYVQCYAMLTYYAVLCYAMLWCAMLCYAMLAMLCMLCYAVLCYAVLCYTMLCYAMLCYAMLWNAMLCCAMLCYAMLCYAMICYAMLCYAMLTRDVCCAMQAWHDARASSGRAMLCHALLLCCAFYAVICCACYAMLCYDMKIYDLMSAMLCLAQDRDPGTSQEVQRQLE